MKILVTGGAGFIGRWVVKRFLDQGFCVQVIDNLSNGSRKNLEEFSSNPGFKGLFVGDVSKKEDVEAVFKEGFDICVHLAAQINVQESLDFPERAYLNNIAGTYNILEAAKKQMTKVLVCGTCMVYDLENSTKPIDEKHPVKPKSPYAGSKIAAEALAESYCLGCGLPVVIVRPFNTYGPFQKANTEGGVVSIFLDKTLKGQELNIYGDGKQTRDLLYVEDCADFIFRAALSEKAVGKTINAGAGADISINQLAELICNDNSKIKHVPHIHPQSEISKLQCDNRLAKALLGWAPKISLEEGIAKTRDWLKNREAD